MRGNSLSLTFGMVNVSIKYAPLADSLSPVSAKTLCPEHHVPLKAGEWDCPEGHKVARDAVVKGYPHPDDKTQLVVVDPAVLEEFAESRSGVANIERIVDFASIEPAYFEKAYIVWPEGAAAEQAFDLFATCLRTQGKAAVTTAVLSKQTRTIVFRWSDEMGCLIAHVCRFSSQIRFADINSVRSAAHGRTEPAEAALELAGQILGTLEGEFDPSEVADQWTILMQDAIRQSAGGEVVKVAKEKKAAPAGDLMAALQASVAEATGKKPAAKRTSRKKAAA